MNLLLKQAFALALGVASVTSQVNATAAGPTSFSTDAPTGFDDFDHPLGVSFSQMHPNAFDDLGSDSSGDDAREPTEEDKLYGSWYNLAWTESERINTFVLTKPKIFVEGVKDLDERGVRFFLNKFFNLKCREENHRYIASLLERFIELDVMTEADYRQAIIWYVHARMTFEGPSTFGMGEKKLTVEKRAQYAAKYGKAAIAMCNRFLDFVNAQGPLSIQNERFVCRALFEAGLHSVPEVDDYKEKARIAYRKLFAREGFVPTEEDVKSAILSHRIYDHDESGPRFGTGTRDEIIAFHARLMGFDPDIELTFGGQGFLRIGALLDPTKLPS